MSDLEARLANSTDARGEKTLYDEQKRIADGLEELNGHILAYLKCMALSKPRRRPSVSEVLTPTEALAVALQGPVCGEDEIPHHETFAEFAAAILAALPEGTAIVTVDSLAAALRATNPPMSPDAFQAEADAAAIIHATKEAERE